MAYNENKAEPLTEPDTANATKFHPEDVTEPRDSWQKDAFSSNRGYRTRREEFEDFVRLNTGQGDRRITSGNQDLQQMEDRMQRFDVIAGQLEMTPYQKSCGRKLRNKKSLRNLGHPDEYVSFCLCAFICRYGKYATRTSENDRDVYHPDRSPERNDMRFVDLAESIGLEKKRIKKCMGQMANVLPPWLSW